MFHAFRQNGPTPPAGCFGSGAQLLTPEGYRQVEDLSCGDLVIVGDGGHRRIESVISVQTRGVGYHAPILVLPGALGNKGMLTLSPGTRVRVVGWKAQLHRDRESAILPIDELVNGSSIVREEKRKMQWHHVSCQNPQLLTFSGLQVECTDPQVNMSQQNAKLFQIEVR
ncbi:Hint domain-containing protein [Aestuariibius sp. HNIBRBA575]|uniref:Hint domain-containing protein n=1 Tax=Aestuariibius sp. HNIBRBA575 TaxID=3233343 RepID=UPI0034A24A43